MAIKKIGKQVVDISKQVAKISDQLGASEPLVVHTSGSTGQPKAISINKEHIHNSALKTNAFLKLKPGDRALLCLPTDKIAGIMMIARAHFGDLQLTAIAPYSKPLEKTQGQFDFVAMVPMQVENSLSELSRVKKLIIGGAPISQTLESAILKTSVEAYHTFGMTETISHVAMRALGQSKYRAMPGVNFSCDSKGRLIINAEDIGVKELRTNDIVRLTDSTSFEWLGRADNVVNSGGVKLHPESIEARVGAEVDFFVAGEPDEHLGERLILIARSNRKLSSSDFDFSQLHRYEVPKEILTMQEFSLTENGKLQRQKTLEKLKR